jgi:hypothetical protein
MKVPQLQNGDGGLLYTYIVKLKNYIDNNKTICYHV